MSARILGRTPLDIAFARDSTGLLLAAMVALIAYLVAFGGFVLVLLGDDIRAWNVSLSNSLTLQLPAETSSARLEMSLALLHQTPGIAAARMLEPGETARLLEPWLGPAAATETLPVPRLVDIRVEPGTPVDIADLRQKLASVVPDMQLDDHGASLGAHRRAALGLAILIAVGLAIVAVLAVALTAALTNLRLAVHRATMELLHLLGAEDAAIAWPVQITALRDGLVGGAIGAAAALFTLFATGHLLPLDASPTLADWRLWGVALAVVTVIACAAMSAARVSVLRRLYGMT
jgi:cell division transport system permease protein